MLQTRWTSLFLRAQSRQVDHTLPLIFGKTWFAAGPPVELTTVVSGPVQADTHWNAFIIYAPGTKNEPPSATRLVTDVFGDAVMCASAPSVKEKTILRRMGCSPRIGSETRPRTCQNPVQQPPLPAPLSPLPGRTHNSGRHSGSERASVSEVTASIWIEGGG